MSRGYDEEAAKIGLNWGPRPRRAKVIVFLVFIVSVIVGGAIASLLK